MTGGRPCGQPADAERIMAGDEPAQGSANQVTDLPQGFKQWVERNAERIAAAKTMPYFITDNWGGRLQEYARYLTDPEYTGVAFNFRNGGLKATHKSHIELPEIHAKELKYFATPTFEGYTGKDLEKFCQDILFENGNSCILMPEGQSGDDGNAKTSLDTLTNGELVDIRSVTKNDDRTIRNGVHAKVKQMKKFNWLNGTTCDQIILYFHDISYFDEAKVRDALDEHKGRGLREIICVFRQGEKVVPIT